MCAWPTDCSALRYARLAYPFQRYARLAYPLQLVLFNAALCEFGPIHYKLCVIGLFIAVHHALGLLLQRFTRMHYHCSI
jgi:hypothetical protein